jgi:hypothetical protein
MTRTVRHRARLTATSGPRTRIGLGTFPESSGTSVLLAEWNQRHVPGPLDCAREHPLMLCTRAGLATWFDLAPVRYIPPQATDILVVDDTDAVHTEMTHLATREVTVSPATKPATARGSSTLSTVTRSGSSAFAIFCHECRSSLVSTASVFELERLVWSIALVRMADRRARLPRSVRPAAGPSPPGGLQRTA